MADMRSIINIVESQMRVVYVKDTEVLINPSPNDIWKLYKELVKPKEGLRATVSNGDLYIWDGYYATHEEVEDRLYLAFNPPLWLYPKKVWLNGSGTDQDELEEWIGEVRACAALQAAYGSIFDLEVETDDYPRVPSPLNCGTHRSHMKSESDMEEAVKSIHQVKEVRSPVLVESRSAPLFHYTYAIEQILKSDKLIAMHKDSRGKCVCLTRDVGTPFFSDAPFLLILDQESLSYSYKMSPAYGDSALDDLGPENEREERVYGDIEPLHRYLKAIVIPWKNGYNGPEYEENGRTTIAFFERAAAAVADYAALYGIPILDDSDVRSNGTWTGEVTKDVVKKYGRKI